MAVKIITQYDYANYEKPGVDFPKNDPNSRSKTLQSDMELADINAIMARYEKTGVIIDPKGVERKPHYGDFTGISDYHAALSTVRQAERVFNALPASIRNKFDNDPQKMIDFVADAANNEELIRLGLKEKPVDTADPAALDSAQPAKPAAK